MLHRILFKLGLVKNPLTIEQLLNNALEENLRLLSENKSLSFKLMELQEPILKDSEDKPKTSKRRTRRKTTNNIK